VLAGRVALGNAAGQGIGRGTAEALAAAGASLVAAALNAVAITSLADDLAASEAGRSVPLGRLGTPPTSATSSATCARMPGRTSPGR
jgi:NAD(P)-dependent dehydrogenase (short-subunit alcohol dehydrogenase family)